MHTLCILFDRKVVHIAYPVVQPYVAVVSAQRSKHTVLWMVSSWQEMGFAESELKQQHTAEKREHE